MTDLRRVRHEVRALLAELGARPLIGSRWLLPVTGSSRYIVLRVAVNRARTDVSVDRRHGVDADHDARGWLSANVSDAVVPGAVIPYGGTSDETALRTALAVETLGGWLSAEIGWQRRGLDDTTDVNTKRKATG